MNEENTAKTITDEIIIDGVLYRITAEFNGCKKVDKIIAEWAMKKVIEEIKRVA